jgi:shikimate dehydrogenase
MLASSKTLVCASLAKSGRTSNAPFMHNTAFKHLELDYVYVSFEPDNIGEAVEAVRTLGLPGGSVSTPYKQSIIEHLDRLDETAKAIGAVNSYKNEGGKIVGYNSDWIGAMGALEEVASVKGKRVAVIGAGGVARAIVYGLIDRGALVSIFNRTPENGKKLAKDFDVTFGGDIDDVKNFKPQILINATSLGKNSVEGLSLDQSVFENVEAVLDVTSSPLITKFLSDAAENGCKTVGGLRMSVLQAAFTFELITGCKAPVEIMYETALSTIKK